MDPAKDKHGVRESNIFIREEWPFPDKGILIRTHIFLRRSMASATLGVHVAEISKSLSL